MKVKKIKTESTFSLTSERCKKCAYSSILSGGDSFREIACLYILDELEPRGCPAGDQCTKFKPGNRIRHRIVPIPQNNNK